MSSKFKQWMQEQKENTRKQMEENIRKKRKENARKQSEENARKQREENVWKQRDIIDNIRRRIEREAYERKLSEEAIICRICREEDQISNFVTPCQCIGSAQHVHTKCLNDWRISRQQHGYSHSSCEVCLQNYKVGEFDFPFLSAYSTLLILISIDVVSFFLCRYITNNSIVFMINFAVVQIAELVISMNFAKQNNLTNIRDLWMGIIHHCDKIHPHDKGCSSWSQKINKLFLSLWCFHLVFLHVIIIVIGLSCPFLFVIGLKLEPAPHCPRVYDLCEIIGFMMGVGSLLTRTYWWCLNIESFRDWSICQYNQNVEAHKYPPS